LPASQLRRCDATGEVRRHQWGSRVEASAPRTDWERGGGIGGWARWRRFRVEQRRWWVEAAALVGEASRMWGDAEIGIRCGWEDAETRIRCGWEREGELTFSVGPTQNSANITL